MNNNLDPLRQYELVTSFTHFINDKMVRIGNRLGIEKKLTI